MTAVGFFGIKFGFGMMEAGANSQLIRLRSARPAALMSLMHLFFGVGSSLGALYAGQALGLGWGWAAVLALSGAIPVLVCMLAAMVRLPDQAAPRPASAGARGPFALFARPEIWIMAGLLTFAVATEVGATSWLVAYLQQGKGMNHKNASLILTAFLISFTLGRLALGWVAERIGYIRLLMISMGFTALSGAAACLLPGAPRFFSSWLLRWLRHFLSRLPRSAAYFPHKPARRSALSPHLTALRIWDCSSLWAGLPTGWGSRWACCSYRRSRFSARDSPQYSGDCGKKRRIDAPHRRSAGLVLISHLLYDSRVYEWKRGTRSCAIFPGWFRKLSRTCRRSSSERTM